MLKRGSNDDEQMSVNDTFIKFNPHHDKAFIRFSTAEMNLSLVVRSRDQEGLMSCGRLWPTLAPLVLCASTLLQRLSP
jgi:hypothetical protein